MTLEQVRKSISRYVPAASLEICTSWFSDYQFRLKVTRARNSKYGDYRPPHNGQGHQITVNHNLNPYAFLITLAHEVAHLAAYEKTGSLKDPHGPAWKAEFRRLLHPLIHEGAFPSNLLPPLNSYILNPAATSCTDIPLLRALRAYDTHPNEWLLLEDLASGARFRIRSGRIFVKKGLIRKNYLCICTRSRHEYTLSPVMEVQPLQG